jgi:hypothetical protein
LIEKKRKEKKRKEKKRKEKGAQEKQRRHKPKSLKKVPRAPKNQRFPKDPKDLIKKNHHSHFADSALTAI